ncbi:hypothetical protein Leryth_026614 [Lithospermum erythrorhizon]|nr:hypothetical protein Leryth_026614 [Lithospermum erythrorhizon]
MQFIDISPGKAETTPMKSLMELPTINLQRHQKKSKQIGISVKDLDIKGKQLYTKLQEKVESTPRKPLMEQFIASSVSIQGALEAKMTKANGLRGHRLSFDDNG